MFWPLRLSLIELKLEVLPEAAVLRPVVALQAHLEIDSQHLRVGGGVIAGPLCRGAVLAFPCEARPGRYHKVRHGARGWLGRGAGRKAALGAAVAEHVGHLGEVGRLLALLLY